MTDSEKPPTQFNHPNTPPSGTQSGGTGLIIAIIVCVLAIAAIAVVIHRHKAAAAQVATARNANPPTPVVVGKVRQKDVPIYLDGLGTVQAFNTVTVRARVDGQLNKVAFIEGQDVHVNDLLAQIDPAPYKAMLDQAISKKAQDNAQLADAQIDLQRDKTLVDKQINSQQTLDTQQALVNQLDAAVKTDQAAIESAQVQLDYTTILSPLEGRTGIRLVDQGNIVHAADTNGLVVITQLKPISVVFTLPEQTLELIHDQMSPGRGADSFTVIAVDRDNRTNLGQGTLAVIDNQIDVTTATIKLKATFPNEDLRLWPGQFVNVRLLLTTRKNGIVVPTPVVQRGPSGAYAFLVEGQGTNLTVKQQTINLALSSTGEAVTDGADTLVDSGLDPGQTVVVDGQYKLQDKSTIIPTRSGGGRGTNQPALEATNP